MRTAALIVAAGAGVRAKGEVPKQYAPLLGQHVLSWSVAALAREVEAIAVAIQPMHEELCRAALAPWPAVRVVVGGETRTASVRAGLSALAAADIVLIHDAARPGLQAETIRALIAAIEAGASAAAPALPVSDALRRLDGGEVAREGLVHVQTPQAFRGHVIRAAYAALPSEAVLSDDLSVAERIGVAPNFVPGDPRLMKLTYPGDFAILERLLSERRICVGSGFDAHRFGEGDHVMLCGVRLEHDRGLVGHSDADAGWHALVDAVLGALGAGDIGAHFPPSDTRWKGASSRHFLQHATALAAANGARILHVDITLICERPKIARHRDAMRQATAEALGVPLDRVSVKATTTERMGFAGREEGLAAQATATLERAR